MQLGSDDDIESHCIRRSV